jgi:sugar phosphate isomerase/epimerase
MTVHHRRQFIQGSAITALSMAISACQFKAEQHNSILTPINNPQSNKQLFKVSLAQWSLHRTIFGADKSADRLRGLSGVKLAETLRNNPEYLFRGKLDPLDFPIHARKQYGIDAVEYVNTFYFGRARDDKYLQELKKRALGEGVTSVLIMCDLEGDLGHPIQSQRNLAVENHHKWVEAAAFLGCHSIRVNASSSSGTWDQQKQLAAEGLHALAEYAEQYNINVLVENHGGLSSNPQWLTATLKAADHRRVGSLPDFGNFTISGTEQYDNYAGVKLLMPYAGAVSAKSLDFNSRGEHTKFDYLRIMRSVVQAGYRGYVGIEYEGEHLSEDLGIRATQALLEKVHTQLLNENISI